MLQSTKSRLIPDRAALPAGGERCLAERDANLNGYLKLYQIHSATLESGAFENRPILYELTGYRQAGLATGLTLRGPRQAKTLERAMQVRLD